MHNKTSLYIKTGYLQSLLGILLLNSLCPKSDVWLLLQPNFPFRLRGNTGLHFQCLIWNTYVFEKEWLGNTADPGMFALYFGLFLTRMTCLIVNI